MKVSGLDDSGDWTFGKGLANYKRRSDAIAQNVATRLKCFVEDWPYDVDFGINWFSLLGNKGTETDILREIERVTLSTFGVRTIEKLEIENVQERSATILLEYRDLFDEDIELVVPL